MHCRPKKLSHKNNLKPGKIVVACKNSAIKAINAIKDSIDSIDSIPFREFALCRISWMKNAAPLLCCLANSRSQVRRAARAGERISISAIYHYGARPANVYAVNP
jgi:hypothetical protein